MRLLVAADSGAAAAVTEAVRRRLSRIDTEGARAAAVGLTLLDDADADAGFDCVVSADDVGVADTLESPAVVRKRDTVLPFPVVASGDYEVTASDVLDVDVTDYVRVRGPERYDEVAARVERTVVASGRRPADLSLVYERVFEQILEGAHLYDRDGRFILVSDLLAGLYGAMPVEFEGERSCLVETICEERPGGPYQRLLDGETGSLEGETELVTPDGEPRILSYRFTPFRMAGGVVGVIGVSGDVTERQEQGQKLKRVREEYQELIDGMNNTVWAIDIDGHILAVNETAAELLGYSRSELLSMTVHDINAGLSDDKASAFVTQMPTDGAQVFETVYRAKDGREIPIEISSSLATYRGETVVLSVAWDITTRKRYEAELREQSRLLETQRDELGILNQVVRHDIRNDLQLVTAYAELFVEYADNGDAREYTEIVRRHVNHAVELTKTTRDMAGMMSTRGVKTKPAPLREVLDVEIASVRDMAPDVNVVVDGEVPPVTVLADDMLGSVFRNLLTNAAQHTDENEPTVDAPATHAEREDRVVVRIAGDGRGVPGEWKDVIFAKDEKELESWRTGLGLYLVQSLVEKYGGDVWVEDNDPSDSVFAVELRLVDGG